MKKEKGAFLISIGTIIGVISLTGIFWSNVSADRERISTLEEAVKTIKIDTTEIKTDIKSILRNQKTSFLEKENLLADRIDI